MDKAGSSSGSNSDPSRRRWFHNAEGGINRVGKLAGSVLAVIALLGAAWAGYGRLRSDSRSAPSDVERLARLGPGLQLRVFSHELGAPDVERQLADSHLEDLKWVTFVHRSFYVTALVETDGTVGYWGVTARDRENPISIGGVTLCRTRMAETRRRLPFLIGISGYYWAEMQEPIETAPDPGDIAQTYDFFAVNPSALACSAGIPNLRARQASWLRGGDRVDGAYGDMEDRPSSDPAISGLRAKLIVNSYGRAAPGFASRHSAALYALIPDPGFSSTKSTFVGPNPDEVAYIGRR